MNRLQAIERLRELADKLEAATDAPCDGHKGFDLELGIHDVWVDGEYDRDVVANYWLAKFGVGRRINGGDYCAYRSDNVTIFRRDPCHTLDPDLLANRDVQLVEIGGGE